MNLKMSQRINVIIKLFKLVNQQINRRCLLKNNKKKIVYIIFILSSYI